MPRFRKLPDVDDTFVVELSNVRVPPRRRKCGFATTCKARADVYIRARSASHILIAACSCEPHKEEMEIVLRRMRIEEIAASSDPNNRAHKVKDLRARAATIHAQVLESMTNPAGVPMSAIVVHQHQLEAAALTYLADCLQWLTRSTVVLTPEEIRRLG